MFAYPISEIKIVWNRRELKLCSAICFFNLRMMDSQICSKSENLISVQNWNKSENLNVALSWNVFKVSSYRNINSNFFKFLHLKIVETYVLYLKLVFKLFRAFLRWKYIRKKRWAKHMKIENLKMQKSFPLFYLLLK